MNKQYEEGRKPFFSESGEKLRKQYVWAKDEKGQEVLQEVAPIDIQQEIESYADECDIKNIVRKASFDPEYLKSLSQGAMEGAEVDITEWPQNIHEYHKMIATAQANAMKLEELQKMAEEKQQQNLKQRRKKSESKQRKTLQPNSKNGSKPNTIQSRSDDFNNVRLWQANSVLR